MERKSTVFVSGKLTVLIAVALIAAAGVAWAQPANTVLLERWNGISGIVVSDLTNNPAYPNSPATRTYPTLFEIPTDQADNYGTRIRGYVTPPTTGNYTFWISGDDNSELWLSTDANPANIRRIAYVSTWTSPRQWTKFPEQTSAAIALTGGTRYYIETRHKEGSGGDNMAVGWQGPGISGDAERPIPGSRLAPFLLVTPPAITAQPANATVAVGQTATFSVAATGTSPAYQWRKNGANISGATSASYTTPAAVAGDNGALFSVVVSNSAGSVTSANGVLTVNSPPAITSQPANVTVAVGQTATFSVAATGSAPLAYQWRRDGINISGATSASYTTPAVMAGDSVNQFSVVVSNGLGSVTSANARISIAVPPTITLQPAHMSVTAGQAATFSVTAAGTAPLAYQWRRNGANIPGATGASYTLPTVASDDSARFAVLVSNAAGSVLSSTVLLLVNVAPSIVTQPVSLTVIAGQPATFSVTAAGTRLNYSWLLGNMPISGANSPTYTIPAATAGMNQNLYSCWITNAAGSVFSASARLTVNSPPEIVTQPANRTVDVGQTATFSVGVQGTTPLVYQWRRNGVDIGGATFSSYTTPAATTDDNGAQFSVLVSNTLGSVVSSNAVLTVGLLPVITTQPAPRSVVLGQTATFTVVATGSAPLAYQWRRNGTNIGGATAASYTTPAATNTDNGALFSVVVSNSQGSAISSNAALTVLSPPIISAQPASRTVNLGQTAVFSVTATGSSPLTYQWRKNGANITGAASSSYTTPSTTTGDNGARFSVVITNSVGTVTSSDAVLTVVTVTSNSRKLAVSGELVDTSGNPIGYPTPVTVDASISLFDAATAGTSRFYEEFRAAAGQGIRVENGLFVARLGEGSSTQNLQTVLSAYPSLWAEITILNGTPDVLVPRTPITGAAFAVGGVPTVAPAGLTGAGDPNALLVEAAVGASYVNTLDNSTWFKLSTAWKRMD